MAIPKKQTATPTRRAQTIRIAALALVLLTTGAVGRMRNQRNAGGHKPASGSISAAGTGASSGLIDTWICSAEL